MNPPIMHESEKKKSGINELEIELKKITNSLNEDFKKKLIGTRLGMELMLFPEPIKIKNYSENEENEENKENKENKDLIEKLMSGEYITLRKYLEELRKCQTTFYWSSIGAIGVMLTIAARLGADQEMPENIIPPSLFISSIVALLVICPIWCVWFEKASSVTRVTSYLRVLEDIISGRKKDQYKYIGWENSYYVYRRSAIAYAQFLRERKIIFRQLQTGIKSSLKSIRFIRNFEPTYQYNILTWCSYFFISLACVVFAGSSLYFMYDSDLLSETELQIIIIAVSVIVLLCWFFTLIYTAHVLLDLSHKNTRSIASREKLWRYLLDKRMFDTENQHYLVKYANDVYLNEFIKFTKGSTILNEEAIIKYFEERNVG